MYADYLLSASVSGLTSMLGCCYKSSIQLELAFNINKCACVAIRPGSRRLIPDLKLGTNYITWSTYCIASDSIISILWNEFIKLYLMEYICSPILQYCSSAVKYNKS